ncbi:MULTISPECIES: phospholipase [unclassified Pseudomonas]|uniref:phospholipase n=1 Tax=unclassified Pseudomonas TaxID=196821 RepID=UPI00215DE0F9|nr:phospholipase [Pseudomonas sp. B21-015]UVM53273.1 phospholipase [Pseudomonas sp. B21-015]
MTRSTAITFDKQKWMSNVPDIDRLKLTDIVWPGTHNAGMDKRAPNHEVVIGNWTTCQNDSFAWQLANGARAFDIRLGCVAGPEVPVFYFHHNGYQSHRILDELVDAVTTFLDQNRDEFIVLDFHQLGDGSKPFDYKQLNDFLMRRLGTRLISASDGLSTVEQLKRASSKRRIVMAAQMKPGLDSEYFWPRIPHKWNGKVFSDTSDLQSHIKTTLAEAPYETFLWSLSATCYSALGGPQHIKNHIDDWFHSSRDRVTRCSIINTDFFDESQIVRYCWIATSMKAVYGHRLHERP